MRIHIWCPRPSDSAIAIRDSLRAKGIRTNKTPVGISGRRLQRFLSRVNNGDLWINWGKPYLLTPGFQTLLKTLNSSADLNKKEQLIQLAKHNVACLEVSDKAQSGWLGRNLNHQEGRDLLNNTGRDYWTKKLPFDRELRIHIYRGKSIHAGLKVPRTDNPHPWIRSYEAGWKIDYSRAGEIAQNRRTLASKAVEALGLDFGAVDIGIVKSTPIVIEVNTAPGLDPGPSVEVYTNKFLEELNGRA